MSNKRLQKTTVYSMRFSLSLFQRIRKVAQAERRKIADMIRLLVEEALNGKG